MKDSIHLKYLIVNETDLLWGLTVNSVGYQSIESNMPYPPGNHPTRYLFSTDRGRILDEYQLLYITKGKGSYISNTSGKKETHPINEGNMFLLFPGEWHNYMPDKQAGWDEYWIGFKGINIDSRVNNGFFNKEKPIYNVGLNNEVVQLYKQAIQIAIEQKSGFQQMLAGIVNHLLGLAYSLDKNYIFESSESVNQINKAKIIILENFKDIKPQDIADQLNMSYSNFRKIFKEYTGFAPSQYIQELKIQKSKELLTNTMIPVKEIAYMMGFENQEYFFTAFKKKNNTTPIEYRKFTQGPRNQ
ncbi:MAG: AraC family transcriptional regulator [Prevotella sp.]|jgi:AraC-like DNA-binding protein|uniref:AraC family transcriptional regulator n=1 Tax=unclassified Dysgonomonas TaxID=2630389 RepID=UPI0025BE1E26|nr:MULTISPECIES: AraC family transcriptional regulator [unclassified Dysgonomonas]MDR1715731.1 AraC family transcriptional regulator [Prevotella sp.]MDR2003152.1 AraC family transcriptional regulator [Prevotella sp.]HMM02362.1 AraC family transcriptional regulator [Dysgonomonas sp.]